MRKAYLGFLLAARLHKQGDQKGWRVGKDQKDLFAEGDKWSQDRKKSKAERHDPRSTRNNKPRHDSPSDHSDVPMPDAHDRGAGDDTPPL